jgi:hypothetical protein
MLIDTRASTRKAQCDKVSESLQKFENWWQLERPERSRKTPAEIKELCKTAWLNGAFCAGGIER